MENWRERYLSKRELEALDRFRAPRWRLSRADVESISERLVNEIAQRVVTLFGAKHRPDVVREIRRVLESELEGRERRRRVGEQGAAR